MTITKPEFLAYERVRRSGRTNMFDVRVVSELSGLPRPKILEIMVQYTKLSQVFLKEGVAA
jgi:hypothetical protein